MANDIIEIIRNYTNDFSTSGLVKLSIDLILVIVFATLVFRLLQKKVKVMKALLIIFIYLLIYLVAFALQLSIFLSILELVNFWGIGLFIIVFSSDIKQKLETFFHAGKASGIFSDEQERKNIINTLVSASEYLQNRKIGGLITIERQDSLNNYIEKAIEVKSQISQEILTTLFFPGTATHDGAVIVRKNRIMCAGAYYPSTEKYDIPKTYGTRHRAAIGISERNDSVTIVISEETGNISLAVGGNLETALTLEKLQKQLENYLTVE